MTKSKHERDLTYESVTGRRASPEQVDLRRWIHKWYEANPEALPGRFRYYEAISAGVITKHAAQTVAGRAEGQDMTLGDKAWQAAIDWVRENGLVPDSWITDTTRTMSDHTGYDSVRDGLVSKLRFVHLDPWDSFWPLIVVESQASAAVLGPLAQEYGTLIAPLRGQASRSFLANRVAQSAYDGQVVLAVVDLDKVGGDISASAHERLEKFATKHANRFTLPSEPARIVQLDWRVVALTEAQVEEHNITLIPRTDRRDDVTRMVAETEALGAATLRAIVRAELDELLPKGRSLVDVRARERDERERLRKVLKRFKP